MKCEKSQVFGQELRPVTCYYSINSFGWMRFGIVDTFGDPVIKFRDPWIKRK